MRLIKRYPEPGATGNYIQVGHHQTAVEYAIAGIEKLHDANLDQLGRDPFNSEMEGSMRAWVMIPFCRVPIFANITFGKRTAKLTLLPWPSETA